MTEMAGPEMRPLQMAPNEVGIDRVLRRSMAVPIPTLSKDFDLRLMREVRRDSRPLDQYRRNLLASYGVVSVVVSAMVMRGQGLDWGVVSGTILAALALVVITRSASRAIHTTTALRHSAR